MRAAAGGGHGDDGGTPAANGSVGIMMAESWTQFANMTRSIYLFHSADIAGKRIRVTSASFSVVCFYCAYLNKQANFLPTLALVGSTPVSNTDLANGDYARLGTTLLSDSTPSTDDFLTASEAVPITVTFALNAAGKAAIEAAALSGGGVIKLGLREGTYDLTGVEPTLYPIQFVKFSAYYSGSVETGYEPSLAITYEEYVGPETVPSRVRGRLVILKLGLSPITYYSTHDVRHPSWFTRGKVAQWGTLSRGIPRVPGSPVTADLNVRLSEFD